MGLIAQLRRGAAAIGLTILSFLVAMFLPVSAGTGCLTSSINVVIAEGGASTTTATGEGGAPVPTVEGSDPSTNEENKDAISYRDINDHPGCTTAGLDTRAPSGAGAGGPYPPAVLAGYKCAAKGYPLVGNEDTTKPILLLVHGNSDAPSGWEKWPAATGAPQLVETASAAGFRVIAVDFRFDKITESTAADKNPGQNFDHGWAVPIMEHLIESVLAAFPDRKISLVGFSLGPTVIRDALRRLHRANKKPFERVKDLVFAAGSHHGVSTFRKLCGPNTTMAGKVACELGDVTAPRPTAFNTPLNGPDGAFETPCLDGDIAFGQKGVCGGKKVRYTTIVMKDTKEGPLADEFVSETSAALRGATNLTVPLTSPDVSTYFIGGYFKNHYGAVRSEAALALIMKALNEP